MQKRSIKYYPQINSVRAIAVTLTLLAHYLSRVGFHEIPYLWLGVDIFFVLSGFLITGILLSKKPVYGKKRLVEIKNFFIRRVLRLFPAYYILIVFFWVSYKLVHLYIWDEHFTYFAFFYVPNWFFFLHPESGSGSFNHLWSLGVEEQFYFVWPWMILFLPLRLVKNLLATVISISLFTRCLGIHYRNFDMLPFNNFQTLGCGGLLAYYYFIEPQNKFFCLMSKYREILFLIIFIALLLVLTLINLNPYIKSIIIDILVACGSSLLILCSVIGWKKPGSFIANSSSLQYLGTISYGIYLYHMPVPDTLRAVMIFFGIQVNYTEHPYFFLIVFFVITVFLAHFSHRFIERPFLKFKPGDRNNLRFSSFS